VSAIVVLGGYGTFGARVSRALAAQGHHVTVAGRDLAKAEALAYGLGGDHRAAAVDASDVASCRRAVRGAAVTVVCAGPFSWIGDSAARAAIEEGTHYADISDDRDYIRRLHGLDAAFRAAGRAAVYGCSSLPAVSSALALSMAGGAGTPPREARVVLFIGGANPKGDASVRAMVERLGRPVRTAHGEQPGFGDPRTVVLPPPFGARTAYTFDGPEHDLFPALIGVESVDVRVGFELPLAGAGFALLARAGARWGRRTAALLSSLARVAPPIGATGGAVMVELIWPDGRRAARALVAEEEGQRMAALPCAMVAGALASAAPPSVGVQPPTAVLAPAELLAGLEAAGMHTVDV
jgi:hypothetical protein